MTEGSVTPGIAFNVAQCECGHAIGDHRSAGTSFPHPPRFGICLISDCICKKFVEKGRS